VALEGAVSRNEIQAIAFDLDNTLVARDRAFWTWIAEECRAAPCHGVDLGRVAELDQSGHGPKEALLAYLAESFTWPESDLAARHRRFVAGTLRGIEPDAAIASLLGRLRRRYRLAVVTNGTSQAQRGKLDRLGISGYFEHVLVSEEVGSKKPEPAIFQRLIEAWPLAPGAIAFVGDDVSKDVLGARAAGLVPVWISRDASWPPGSAPPLQIRDVLELEALLDAR
jgi:putative hydrolase of the HAD superfamily